MRSLRFFHAGESREWERAVGALSRLSSREKAECFVRLTQSVLAESCERQPVVLANLRMLFKMAVREGGEQVSVCPADSLGIVNETLEKSVELCRQFWVFAQRFDVFRGNLFKMSEVMLPTDRRGDDGSSYANPTSGSEGSRPSSSGTREEGATTNAVGVELREGFDAMRACCDKMTAAVDGVMRRLGELERRDAEQRAIDKLASQEAGRLQMERLDELERAVVGKVDAAIRQQMERLDGLERGVVGRLDAAIRQQMERLDELERGMASRLDAAIRAATGARPVAADPPPVPRAPDSTTVRPAAGGIRPAGYRTAAAPKAEASRNSLSPEHSRGSIVHESVFRPAGVVDYSRADNDIRRTDLQYFRPADRDDALLLRTDTERFTSPTSPFSSPRRSASRLA